MYNVEKPVGPAIGCALKVFIFVLLATAAIQLIRFWDRPNIENMAWRPCSEQECHTVKNGMGWDVPVWNVTPAPAPANVPPPQPYQPPSADVQPMTLGGNVLIPATNAQGTPLP